MILRRGARVTFCYEQIPSYNVPLIVPEYHISGYHPNTCSNCQVHNDPGLAKHSSEPIFKLHMDSTVTPPYSDIQTPPPTDEKVEKSPTVLSLVEFCRQCQSGNNQVQTWTRFDVTSVQWIEFQQLVESDELLKVYVKQTLRYGHDF